MEKEQAFEWAKAQKIVITTDLIVAAKNQLQFLEIVDRNRQLYNGPALDRVILRYKNCWLPLLAKHSESKFPEGQLVVPLDCEWIWHCHRLNPVRYITDCKQLFGRILSTSNVVSSTKGACTKKTEKIWKMVFPEEPYELNIASENKMVTFSSTNYDLVSAVKRQTTFFYQVSGAYMKDDIFLEGAVERYKGFLHLIRRNAEKKSKSFYVPTYDIDLIWHSHQLNPVSYNKDLRTIVGNVLEHDDTDSNKVKGGKLDIGFRKTTKEWEETFGLRYWRAGAMYRGPAPSPLSIVPQFATTLSKKLSANIQDHQDIVKLPTLMLVEVLLDIVEVRNVPFGNKGSLILGVSKKNRDFFFKRRRNLSVSLDAGVKQVVCFQCEPTGDLNFELSSYFPSESKPKERSIEILGTTSISLQELMNSGSKLSVQKWFEFEPADGTVCFEPISLSIAVSVTPPVPGPYKLTMVKGYPVSRNMSSFPLVERVEKAKKWTTVVDEEGNEVFSILMRDPNKSESGISTARKEVLGMAKSGEKYLLAEFNGEGWTFMGSQWFLPLQKNGDVEDEYIFELLGSKKMIMFHGRKLGYEIKNGNKNENEGGFMTLVEFSSENPYGKAMALLNLRIGFLEVEEKRLVLPAITLAFILSDILTIKKDGYDNNLLTTRGDKNEDYWCDESEENGDSSGDESMKSCYCGLFNAACLGSDCGILGCSATCSAGCSSPCSSPCMSK